MTTCTGCNATFDASYKYCPQCGRPNLSNASTIQEINGITIEWVYVPAGPFMRGSDKRQDKFARGNETPQTLIEVPAFRMARTPVTYAQYRIFLEATNRRPPKSWKQGKVPPGKDNYPVEYVTLLDAQAFCIWIGAKLPSENEWEKSARGTDGRIYPWGNEPPDSTRCNWGGKDTKLVGQYPKGASFYGVMDMMGSVWEWTSSLYYEHYVDNAIELYRGHRYNVLKGSPFRKPEAEFRAAKRCELDGELESFCGFGVGFRCAQSV